MIALLVLIVWMVVFLCALADALCHDSLDPVTRLTWVVVLIFVPFFGVLLYACLVSKPRSLKGVKGSDTYGTPWAEDPGHSDSKL